jgi:hypothetical protein
MDQLNQDVWQDRAMIQFLAMNYCLMKQMPTLRHLGEQSNHALGLAASGRKDEGRVPRRAVAQSLCGYIC